MSDYFLEVKNLTKYFVLNNDVLSRLSGKTRTLKAVDDISFFIKPGETLGLVGESGCGKSTTARLVTRLIEPSSGTMLLKGEDLVALPPSRMLEMRKTVQLVFQDPYSSLNPRKTVMQILSRPLEVHNLAHGWAAKRRQVLHLLRLVGMGIEHADRYPHEFSGGQRQRLAIARALAVKPQLIIGDEPVSALDVSIQAQILNLFRELQEDLTVDLSVYRARSQRDSAYQRPCGSDVCWEDRRNGNGGGDFFAPATSLHPGVARGGSRGGSAQASTAPHPARRTGNAD